MPNAITTTGLTIKSLADITADLTAAMKSIYGNDINLAPDTPDGQMLGIFAEAVADALELIQQVNAMFDPDQAIGVILDQRVAYNGIQRQAGTYTVTNISIVTSQALTLYGLDQVAQPVYTVSDNAGNQWKLITTQNPVSSGTFVYSFQSSTPGAVQTVPNTITVPVSIVIGVSTINNPTTFTTLGLNEETDAALRIRRQQSVSLASQGYLAGLLAALENISGVTSAFIEENNTGSTNADGVTGHSIWVIVSGTGAAAAIAQAIYSKRNAGCGLVGTQTYNITQSDGSLFTVKWDNVIQVNLFAQFTLTSIDGVNPPQAALIKSGLATRLLPSLYQTVNVNELATLIQAIDPNALVTSPGVGAATTQILTLSAVAASGTFKVSYNGVLSSAINWNDSISTIQTKVRAVTGLSAATCTGSIATQTITIALAVDSSLGLISVKNNGLLTAGSAAITFAYNFGLGNTAIPATKQKQFAVASANLVVLPIVLTNPSATTTVVANVVTVALSITHGGLTSAFGVVGGYGTMVYTIQSGAGSINSSSGVYTSAAAGTDVVLVTDDFGNTAICTVTVT